MVRVQPPPVIALVSRRSGTGKTACTVNAAAALAESGCRVLVVDLDAQASATLWLGSTESRSLADAVVEGTPLEAVTTPVPGVDLVPSAGCWLARAEKMVAGEVGRETVFRNILRGLLPGPWNVVLIDTPPGLGLTTVGALVAADRVLIPIESSSVALQSVTGIVQALPAVRRVNPELRLGGIVMTRLDETQRAREVLESVRHKFRGMLVPVVIRDRASVRESWGYQQPVTVYDPTDGASEDYRKLAEWIVSTSQGMEERRDASVTA